MTPFWQGYFLALGAVGVGAFLNGFFTAAGRDLGRWVATLVRIDLIRRAYRNLMRAVDRQKEAP